MVDSRRVKKEILLDCNINQLKKRTNKMKQFLWQSFENVNFIKKKLPP